MDVKEILLQFFRKRKREELVGMRYFVRSNKAHICRVDAEQELDCIRKKLGTGYQFTIEEVWFGKYDENKRRVTI